jgi:general secretion pathway protein M
MNSILQRKGVVAIGVTVGSLLVLALLAGQYVVRKHLWGLDRLEQIEPRHARLLGLRESGPRLEEGLKQARAALPRLGYPADRDAAQVGNDLQQLARRALQTAGLSVTSSQVLPPRAEAGYERISVTLQADGPLTGVQVALAALQSESPRLGFDSVVLQSVRRNADDGSPVVSCRVTVFVLRLQS